MKSNKLNVVVRKVKELPHPVILRVDAMPKITVEDFKQQFCTKNQINTYMERWMQFSHAPQL